MQPQRLFLDWQRPVTETIRDVLLENVPDTLVDLSATLIIVPTRQAGRRLREALALRCAESGRALIPPVVSEPLFFLSEAAPLPRVAGPLMAQALWMNVVGNLTPETYPGLFPVAPPAPDLAWALHTSDLIQSLRSTLIEAGYLIRDVANRLGTDAEEAARWQDLAQLETRYLHRLAETGLVDRNAHLIEQAETPNWPNGLQRILVAALPDPSPLMIRALEQAPADWPVTILIHAPANLADAFDAWGRPQTAYWQTAPIDIEDPDRNILLGADPLEQARLAIEEIAAEARHIGPSDLAIGVPDPEVIPHIDAQLAKHGLIAFNPAGRPLNQHRLYHYLERSHRVLVDHPPYDALRNWWRHPDVLLALQQHFGVDPAEFLKQLDEVQNAHLPRTLEDLTHRIAPDPLGTPIQRALALLHQVRAARQAATVEEALAHGVQPVYAVQEIDPQKPEHDLFMRLAGKINKLTAETRHPAWPLSNRSHTDTLYMILHQLRHETVYEEREKAQVDLEGWLELHWNTARFMIVTGMNEGRVPDSRLSDVFLPDSLRRRLGLRSDQDRVARDAYLMAALIACRRDAGRITFIAGARSRTGDPLKPSRLLFRCDEAGLPRRAQRLFREPKPSGKAYPASVSFRLQPAPGGIQIPDSISVTQFAAYLSCPYRFYLSHVLRAQSVEDDKQELDAMDFGLLVHDALEAVQVDSPQATAAEWTEKFTARALDWVRQRHGDHPPLPVRAQFDTALQRLKAAAQEQETLQQEGWQTKYTEEKISLQVGPMRLTGKLDRVDYHPPTNTWRIIDYKTAEKRQDMTKHHFAGVRAETPDYARTLFASKLKRWINLQLPLYIMLFRRIQPAAQIQAGIFHLPKAVGDTGLEIWEALDNPLIDSAWQCANAIIEQIAAGQFWPPADQVEYEDFETLFPFPASTCLADWRQDP